MAKANKANRLLPMLADFTSDISAPLMSSTKKNGGYSSLDTEPIDAYSHNDDGHQDEKDMEAGHSHSHSHGGGSHGHSHGNGGGSCESKHDSQEKTANQTRPSSSSSSPSPRSYPNYTVAVSGYQQQQQQPQSNMSEFVAGLMGASSPPERKKAIRCTLDKAAAAALAAGGPQVPPVEQDFDAASKKARKQLWCAAIFCSMFMVGELLGGYYANSLSLMTDAAHLLSDLAGFMISIFALWLASQEATARHSFGFHRAEILGALLSVLLIWALTGVLVYEATLRVMDPPDVNGKLMFFVALGGLTVNIVMGFILHQSGHGHSHGLGGGHGHSHGGGDDHGHAHGSSKTPARKSSHGHSHGGSGDSEEGQHGHSHSHQPQPSSRAHAHSHGGSADEDCEQGHEEDHHGHSHGGTPKESQQQPLLLSNRGRSSSPANTSRAAVNNGSAPTPTGGPAARSTRSLSISSDYAPADSHQQAENINVKAAFIHVVGDALQSVGVMLAAGLIWYNPEWKIADPICTFLFSILVLLTTVRLVQQSISVLMEGVPEGIDPEAVDADLAAIEGVLEVHDLHIWSLSVGKPALSVHIRTRDDASHVLSKASKICARKFGIKHTTIQIEVSNDKLHCSDA